MWLAVDGVNWGINKFNISCATSPLAMRVRILKHIRDGAFELKVRLAYDKGSKICIIRLREIEIDYNMLSDFISYNYEQMWGLYSLSKQGINKLEIIADKHDKKEIRIFHNKKRRFKKQWENSKCSWLEKSYIKIWNSQQKLW